MRIFSHAIVLLLVAGLVGCGLGPEVYTESDLPADRFEPGAGETVVVFVGDTMPWDSLKRYVEDESDYPYRATRGIVERAHVAVANLEGPVAVDAPMRKGLKYGYKMPPSVLAGVRDAGFDLVSMANNHLWDCGEAGAMETMRYLDDAGIPFVGAGRNQEEAGEAVILESGGVRIAFVAVVSPETWFPEPETIAEPGAFKKRMKNMHKRMGARKDRAGTVVASELKIKLAVQRAKKDADYVVVYPHWGVRYHRPVYEFQEKIARAAIDAGADLVVGHHAHIWQPVGVYRGRPVVYGLGNYAFGSGNPRADEGLIARAVFKDGHVTRVELLPLATRNAAWRIRYQSKVMKGEAAREMLTELVGQSAPLGANVQIEDGIGVLDLPEPEPIDAVPIQGKEKVAEPADDKPAPNPGDAV